MTDDRTYVGVAAISLAISLLLILASSASALRWTSPTCGDAQHSCVDLYLQDTGANQTPSLSGSSDYRIHLPSVPLRGGLQIRGGHNVIIVGGEIDLAVPCSDSSSACHGINIDRTTAGTIYIEGVWIHDPQSLITQSTGDGIDLNGDPRNVTNLTLQNVRIDGISGCSGGPDHADVFQPYSVPNSTIRIDHLTGTSNCQGLQIDPDYAWTYLHALAKTYTIFNVNVTTLPNPWRGNVNEYMWWFTDTCQSGPISLTNVYTQEPDGTLQINSVWPDTDQPAACKSVWDGTTLSFPQSPQIKGRIVSGAPPGGDFVPVGRAGLRYGR